MTNCKTCMKEMQEKLLQIARDGATGGRGGREEAKAGS